MATMQIFAFEEKEEIRTLLINDEPYFVGKDVADALGYKNTRDALSKHVDEEDKGVANRDTLGGKQELTIINESGLYSLIFKSQLPSSKKFKRWVTNEVLPAIRKNGMYVKENQTRLPQSPMEVLKLMFDATEEIQEEVEEVKERVTDLEENQVLGSGDYGYIARRIHQRVSEIAKGYGNVTQEQRGELYKDINGGIKRIAGVGSRTQLRTKHYQLVIDFINDWEPSTATKTIVRQMSLLEEVV